MRLNVDYGILVEEHCRPDGRRLIWAMQWLASDHVDVLGGRGGSDPSLSSARIIANWDKRHEVFG